MSQPDDKQTRTRVPKGVDRVVDASTGEVKGICEQPQRNWTEDDAEYRNRCWFCGHLFLGHKYRRSCRECEPPRA